MHVCCYLIAYSISYAVFEYRKNGMTLIELMPGVELNEVYKKTEARFNVDLKKEGTQ